MKQRLLVADRDIELCEDFARFLTEQGYYVETSTDALECVAKLRQMTPAVLVLDLELLWGGGDGVLAWLRDECPATTVPVLLTGAVAASPDLAEFDQSLVVNFLPKPFTLTALLESVRAAVAIKERRELSSPHRVPVYSELFIG